MKNMKKVPVFRIVDAKFVEGEWCYAFNRRNYVFEHMIRPLDAMECGIVGVKPV